MAEKPGPEAQVREIRRRTRHRYSAEERIRIVLEGLEGDESIAELCRRESTSASFRFASDLATFVFPSKDDRRGTIYAVRLFNFVTAGEPERKRAGRHERTRSR